ncbi:MAG: YIP1 family protein [Burkholderiaceae bacterium]
MKNLIDVFLQPSAVLGRLKDQPNFLLPLLLIVGLTAVASYLYFEKVDAVWFMERSIAASGQEVSDKELQAIRASGPNSNMLKWTGSIGGSVGILVSFLAFGLYYFLAGKVTGLALNYKQGLALAAWSAMPTLISSVLLLVGVFSMTPQTPLESLVLTSVDPMLVQLPLDSPWKGLATSASFLTIWTTWLAALGWKLWSQAKTWTGAVVVAALPTVLIYGGMAIKALLN